MIRETEENRIEQRRAMDIYMAPRTGLRHTELKPYTQTDFLVAHIPTGNIVEAVEVKRRYHTFGTYESVIMEPEKLAFGLSLARGLKLDSTYLVLWDDRIGWANMRWITPVEAYGGRHDRGEWGDEGIKLFVPLEQFTTRPL